MATIEEKQQLVATFMEITQTDSAEHALYILMEAGWKLDKATELFFDGGYEYQSRELRGLPFYASLPFEPTPEGSSSTRAAESWEWRGEGSDCTNLTRLFSSPSHMMHKGNFHQTKAAASIDDKWLLINVQSRELFDSQRLNRDTWSNSTVVEIIRAHFVFWQINHDEVEGMKVCCYYKLESLPAIMVVDPITGEKMYDCQGMKQPEDLLEELVKFSDESPTQHHSSIVARSRRGNAIAGTHSQTDEESKPTETSPAPAITKLVYPPLPEEPTEKHLICRVSICLPTGQRVQRSFLKTDSIKLLWSFCSTLLKEEDTRRFCFMVPSSPIKLTYVNDTSFEDAGLCNMLVRLAWED